MRQIWKRQRGVSPRDQAFDELAKAAAGGSRLSRRQVVQAVAIAAGVGAAGQIIGMPRAKAASSGSCTLGNYAKCRDDAAIFAGDLLDVCVKGCGSRGSSISKAQCLEICLETEAVNYAVYIESKCDTLSCPAAGETCVAGFCRCGRGPSCGPPTTCCDGECVDLAHDHANCGSCGNNCGTPGLDINTTCCDGTCTDTSEDSNNCGICGRVCPADLPTCCDKFCTDTSIDPGNCGDCGNVCPSGNCVNAKCTCSEFAGCPDGYDCCTANGVSTCVDTSNDTSNCGSCGNVCGAGETCTAGQCSSGGGCGGGALCTGNQICCSGTCVNFLTDSNNCGDCGHVCPAGVACTQGVCGCGGGSSGC
jgi:Stigma-specific protein, Stig1